LVWAEDSTRLANEQEDGLVWPEFANDEDSLLTWEGLDPPMATEIGLGARRSADWRAVMRPGRFLINATSSRAWPGIHRRPPELYDGSRIGAAAPLVRDDALFLPEQHAWAL